MPTWRRWVKPIRARARRKRHEVFLQLIAPLPRPISIVDVGGAQRFWELVELIDQNEVNVTLVNVRPMPTRYPNFQSVTGDARSLTQFGDRAFDVVFSNSVIEHVGSYEDQAAMAGEVMRIGRYFYVQTPNRRFPIEAHFYFPLFQFLPTRLRVWLVRSLPLYPGGRIKSRARALEVVSEIRLMTLRELKALFPGAKVRREKTLGLTKSFMVFGESPR